MTPKRRVVTCSAILLCALGAQAGLEAMTTIDRPALRKPLSTLPMNLGSWVGEDVPVADQIVREAQTDDFLNRVYEDQKNPGRKLWVWINYSKKGLNMRHSPEICLPGNGWTKVEANCRVLRIEGPEGKPVPVTQLGYAQGELVQSVGFWYYIFGEGELQRYVRGLPITSRSSHGRTTRGSGMTVELFCPGTADPYGEGLRDLSAQLLPALEPILPENQAQYYIP
jgi:Protein of unknown function (DUF3485)